MIEIVGTALNQWDTGRVVHITGVEAEHAHFANKGDSKAVIMGVVDNEAKIPDYLLQTGKPLCVYAVKDGVTIESMTFSVRNRERPENYVYEDDQRNYIYELITNVETAIEAANKAAAMAAPARLASVTLLASKWTGSNNLYSQVVAISGITENSQVNLTPSVEQLAVFYDKDITFVTENDGGVVTVYVIGQKPQNDYTIQANIAEVLV